MPSHKGEVREKTHLLQGPFHGFHSHACKPLYSNMNFQKIFDIIWFLFECTVKSTLVKISWLFFFRSMQRLPPAFGQRYGSILPENAKLRINSGKTWDLKVEQMEDGQFCFTRGWENFVKDVGLEMGEFLVFRFVGKSMLDVSVYGTSACEREIPASSFQVEDSDPDEDHVELSKDCKYNVPG